MSDPTSTTTAPPSTTTAPSSTTTTAPSTTTTAPSTTTTAPSTTTTAAAPSIDAFTVGLAPVGDPGSNTELSVAPGTKIVLYWRVSGDFASVCIGDEPVPKAVMSQGHLERTPTESSADADGKVTYTLT